MPLLPKQRPGGGAARDVGYQTTVEPLYLTFDGETIAPLSVVVAAELSRRRDSLARIARCAA